MLIGLPNGISLFHVKERKAVFHDTLSTKHDSQIRRTGYNDYRKGGEADVNEKELKGVISGYVERDEIPGCALLVRKNGKIMLKETWGVRDRKTGEVLTEDTIFRLMSMTKVITAATVMTLVEPGEIRLDDPVSRYVPEFANPTLVDDPRYSQEGEKLDHFLWKMITFSPKRVRTCPSPKEATIRDLLSHASGYEQGWAGLLAMLKRRSGESSLEKRMLAVQDQPLDFVPGTRESYSPTIGFDLLGYIVEKVSGVDLESYMRQVLFEPLKMTDTTFNLSEEQRKRLVRLYQRKKDRLEDVTDKKPDMEAFLKMGPIHYAAGCGGLYGTLNDYDHFGQMMFQEGSWEGKQILKPETIRLMHTEAQQTHLEPDPGMTWGLGVKIRQDPIRAGSPATPGTYGWSGAFGTHFFISPKDGIQTVFMANRSDLGGSGSYISMKVEELVFENYGNKEGEEHDA